MATFFVGLSKKDADLATDIIATYIKEGAKAVNEGKIRGGMFANHIKPIKVLPDYALIMK